MVTSDGRQQLGAEGEAAARSAVRQRGYVILAERYRTRLGEIDLIARDRDTIVFIEVKTRRDVAYGGGAAAVTARKQRRLVRVAEMFLAQARFTHVPCRFDVVAVDWPAGGQPRAEVYPGAFTADSS